MYCKLFASLYQGTLRGKANEILVFTNLLAHCDKDGFVDKHWRAIAEEVGLSIEEVKDAIVSLESPDEESRSPEENGSRLLRLDEHRAWGWRVVNYGKYRAIRNSDDRREQNRLAKQRQRKSKMSAKVSHESAMSAHAEAEAEAEAEAQAEEEGTPQPPKGGSDDAELIYKAYPRKVGKPNALKAIGKAVKTFGRDKVLNATTLYAEKVACWPPNSTQFVPHPATWFNQQRFNDDSSTWERAVNPAEAKKQMDLLQCEIDNHPANPQSASYAGQNVTDEQLDDLRGLRSKQHQLQLGSI